MFTVEEEEEKNIFTGLELIEDRGKQVEAHVDTLTYEGLESPILLAQDSAGGCGGMKWEAADVLIDYFIWKHKETSELLDNKTVVELGAGTGLVGLAVAKLCRAKKVILTDQMPMMNLMQENIKLNKLEEKMKAEILNWGEEIPEESELLDVDIILASDCVYLEVAFIPLLETLLALAKKDTVIYLAYKKRRKADKRFFQLARKKFELIEVQDDPKREEYNKRGLRFYIFKRK